MTYVAVVVQLVVGQLELVKGDDLFGPLGAFGRRVRMNVDPRRRVGVRFARHHPAGAVEGVSVPLVVHGHEIHHEHVVGIGVQAKEAHLESWEHPPACADALTFGLQVSFCLKKNEPSSFGDNHLGAQLIEFVPQCLHLQTGVDSDQLGMERLFGFRVGCIAARARLAALATRPPLRRLLFVTDLSVAADQLGRRRRGVAHFAALARVQHAGQRRPSSDRMMLLLRPVKVVIILTASGRQETSCIGQKKEKRDEIGSSVNLGETLCTFHGPHGSVERVVMSRTVPVIPAVLRLRRSHDRRCLWR